MTPFELDLYIEKSKVVRGESIRFVATLISKAKNPHELRSLDPVNRVLEIRLTDADGGELRGDALNLSIREGDMPLEDEDSPMMTLPPGGKVQATGDVLTWIGEVPPGEYMLRASYNHASFAYAVSKDVPLTIVDAAPFSARTVWPNACLAYNPRCVAWLNGSQASPELFLLETSPFLPEVWRANRPLATLPPGGEVWVSTSNVHPPAAIHLTWLAGPTLLRVLRIPGEAAPEPPVDVPLPISGLRPVREPFSDEKGGLAMVLVAPGLERAMFLRLPPGGKPVATPINPRPPLAGPRAAFWTEDENLVLLWTGPDRREVHGALTPMKDPANPLEGKRLFAAPFSVACLRPYQDYDARKDAFVLKALVLCHDRVKDLFLELRVNLLTGAVESQKRCEADGLGRLRVLQIELDADHSAAFLFAEPDGNVLYGGPDFSKIRPLEVETEVPLTTGMSPSLLAANRFSDSPGHYLLFIRDGERFEVRKL